MEELKEKETEKCLTYSSVPISVSTVGVMIGRTDKEHSDFESF